jgi:hypothetical protein
MLKKMVDIALSATFLAVHGLYKLRSHLESRTVPALYVAPDTNAQEDRLMVEWIEAVQERSALQAECDKPTFSRKLGAQAKLVNAIKTSGDKCHRLLVALRAHREVKR